MQASTSADFANGARVEGRYLATSRGAFGTSWFPATVSTVNGDGTYGLRYDDGDTETRVLARFVVPVGILFVFLKAVGLLPDLS